MHKNSFTIIELLVVIAIVAVIAVIVFPNYKSGQRQFALERSAHKLAQDIRRAQQMAMSAEEYQGEVPPGYGIHLNSQQGKNFYYILYADINPAQGNQKFDSEDEIEKIYFEEGVEIEYISPAVLSINFEPPDPKVTIKGIGDDTYTEITLTLSDESKTKIITVNKAGLISISD